MGKYKNEFDGPCSSSLSQDSAKILIYETHVSNILIVVINPNTLLWCSELYHCATILTRCLPVILLFFMSLLLVLNTVLVASLVGLTFRTLPRDTQALHLF